MKFTSSGSLLTLPSLLGVLLTSYVVSGEETKLSTVDDFPQYSTNTPSIYAQDFPPTRFVLYPHMAGRVSGTIDLDAKTWQDPKDGVYDCSGDSIDAAEITSLSKLAGGLPVFVLTDYHCTQSGESVKPIIQKLITRSFPEVGGISLTDDEPSVGYWIKRAGFWAGHEDPSIITVQIGGNGMYERWTAIAADRMKQNPPLPTIVTIRNGENEWIPAVFANQAVAAFIYIYGICASLLVVTALYVLINWVRQPVDPKLKMKAGDTRLNLMVNILIAETIANIIRALGAFGTGFNIVPGLYCGLFCLFITTGMPNLLLFSNAISTTNAWVKMTQMTTVSAGELNKSLAKFHLIFFLCLFVIDIIRDSVLTGVSGSVFNYYYNGFILLYTAIILAGIITFIRSVIIVQRQVGSTAKMSSAGGKTNPLQLFMKRVSLLAYGMGVSMTVGFMALIAYTQLGMNNIPNANPPVQIGGQFLFLFASACQMSFAMVTLIKKPAAAEKRASSATQMSLWGSKLSTSKSGSKRPSVVAQTMTVIDNKDESEFAVSIVEKPSESHREKNNQDLV